MHSDHARGDEAPPPEEPSPADPHPPSGADKAEAGQSRAGVSGARASHADPSPARKSAALAEVLAAAYLMGSVPFAQIVARVFRAADLRTHGTGTVSATGLREVAGVPALVFAGALDLTKGTVGTLLAGGRRRPATATLAAAAVVSGHNWSPFLRGAGGRGISPAMGALLVLAPEGAAVLLAGLAAGRAARQTGVGALVADIALIPVLARTRGRRGVAIGTAVLVPMLAKRLLGNSPAPAPSAYLWRLLFDRDQRTAPSAREREAPGDPGSDAATGRGIRS